MLGALSLSRGIPRGSDRGGEWVDYPPGRGFWQSEKPIIQGRISAIRIFKMINSLKAFKLFIPY
jgi:hypothetical protein